MNKCNTSKIIKKKFRKEIYKYTDPKIAQKRANKYFGKNVKLYPSYKKEKKYMICNQKTKKWVSFGQVGYQDFTKHKNKTRRKNYLRRTANIIGNWKNDKYSANNLSRNILWG